MGLKITGFKAFERLDSRGVPTLEVTVATEGGGLFSALVPSGTSTGGREAFELRDGGKRFNGKGVLKAASNVNKIISKKLVGFDTTKQKELDAALIELDGTPNKSRLGANAILGASLACARAGAFASRKNLYEYLNALSRSSGAPCKPGLPTPLMNFINGGRHAGTPLRTQEHLILPIRFKSFPEALEASCATYQSLKKILEKKFGRSAVNVGDEGGFAPSLSETEDALEFLALAIEENGFSKKIFLGLDCAASEFYDEKTKNYGIAEGKKFSSGGLIDFYSGLIEEYRLASIEDGFAEDDWLSWKEFTKKFGSRLQIIGDDLLCTNPLLIKRAVREKACNALLLKPNQIGTLSEALAAAQIAFENDWRVCVSHRSGETEDAFIADLAVGLGCGECKFGAPARGERTAKYNQLLRLNELLGKKAEYFGTRW